MELSLRGKVALVTGASRGIGYKIAEVFGDEGCKVAICGRDSAGIKDALAALRVRGIDAFGMSADVSNDADFRKFADGAEECFGGIDIWFNNAGVYPQKKITDMSLEQWDQAFALNVRSVFIGAKLAREKLSRRGGGVLFNASSFAALMPSVTSGAYAATKSAIYSMTKSLAAELAPLNIRVIGYIPGVIETDMTQAVIESAGEGLYAQQALHRVGCSADVAYPLLFFASDHASYITGSFIEMTGGKFCVQNPLQAW